MKTKIKTLWHTLSGAACAGALLIVSSASAQTLLVANYQPGIIDEVTVGGSVTPYLSGLAYPYGMAFDSAGDFFEANSANDSGNGTIVEYLLNGTHQTISSGIDPKGLVFNSAGDLFESDYHSGNINIYSNGVWSTFATGFSAPQAMAFNSAGDLFVAAGYPNGSTYISEITPGGTKTQIASSLSGTSGLAINSLGDIFEADTGSGNIFEFTPGMGGSYAKTTYISGLVNPDALVIDGMVDLFVSDSNGSGTSYITEITPNLTETVIANGLTQPNGMVLMPVPEPSTWALMAVGASAFFFRYRRKNSAA